MSVRKDHVVETQSLFRKQHSTYNIDPNQTQIKIDIHKKKNQLKKRKRIAITIDEFTRFEVQIWKTYDFFRVDPILHV